MNAATNSKAKCGCGAQCAGDCGCEARCCELECLVRPNFFCGQLLTDADLATMLEWTRQRLALARYRDGWGIACGLELSCGAPGEAGACCGDNREGAGPALYLNAGYALDCCGNDLVVCDPLRIDLGPACLPPVDICDPRPTPAPVPTTVAAPPAAGEEIQNCMQSRADELFAVRLSLRYHEDPAQAQRAMFRGPCADDGPCQYTRIHERPCVHLEIVPLRENRDERSDIDRWRAEFRERLTREVAILRAAAQPGLGALLRYIRENPPYQFCYLEELVCCLLKRQTDNNNNNNATSFQDLLAIARLIMADWMLRQLACECASCLPDLGVPLGRVIMRRQVVARRSVCSLVMMEQSPQFRRALRRDICRPLDPAALDLGAYLGRPASALGELRMRGAAIRVVEANVDDSGQLDEVIGAFAGATLSYIPTAGSTLAVHLANDIVGAPRIALFVEERTPT